MDTIEDLIREEIRELKEVGERATESMRTEMVLSELIKVMELQHQAAVLWDAGIQKKKALDFDGAKSDISSAIHIYDEIFETHAVKLHQTMLQRKNPIAEDDAKRYRKMLQDNTQGLMQASDIMGKILTAEGDSEKAQGYYRRALAVFQKTEEPTLFSCYIAGGFYWSCRDKTDPRSVQESGRLAIKYLEKCVAHGKDAQEDSARGALDKKAFQFSCEGLGHLYRGYVPGFRDDAKSYHYFCLASNSGLDCTDQLAYYKKGLFGKIKYIGK